MVAQEFYCRLEEIQGYLSSPKKAAVKAPLHRVKGVLYQDYQSK